MNLNEEDNHNFQKNEFILWLKKKNKEIAETNLQLNVSAHLQIYALFVIFHGKLADLRTRSIIILRNLCRVKQSCNIG